MKHEGKLLEKYLADTRSNASKLASKLNISKQAVYAQIEREQLSNSFLERLKNIGIELFAEENGNHNSINSEYSGNEYLEQLLKAKDEIIALQAQRIELLLAKIDSLEKNFIGSMNEQFKNVERLIQLSEKSTEAKMKKLVQSQLQVK